MSSLHKLKAYFGMVSADEDDGGYVDGYAGGYGGGYGGDYAEEVERPARYRPGRSRAHAGTEVDAREPAYAASAYEPAPHRSAAPRLEPLTARRAAPGGGHTTTRGALAVDDRPEPLRRSNPFAEDGHPLAKITTLHPRTYNEARTIGERYREGNPVIMNLTEMSDSDAKRLVDFAAGLAFAMRGAIDKVTNKVFLLSPSDVDVSAEDKRRIVENGFFNQS